MADNHDICLKTEVAVECAAGVTGFIFRNYDLQNKPYPQDIAEIYERNAAYNQSLYKDRILDEIKADNEYVKKHTPLPHR